MFAFHRHSPACPGDDGEGQRSAFKRVVIILLPVRPGRGMTMKERHASLLSGLIHSASRSMTLRIFTARSRIEKGLAMKLTPGSMVPL